MWLDGNDKNDIILIEKDITFFENTNNICKNNHKIILSKQITIPVDRN